MTESGQSTRRPSRARTNADPGAIRILCFGDSNTHGTCLREGEAPGSPTADPDYVRLDADHRWPGVLQHLLGDRYEVIEDGLDGRTTEVDDDARPNLNGRQSFVPCIRLHRPLDAVVVMLGGNDLKPSYRRTPAAVAAALAGYVDDVASHLTRRGGQVPEVVLVGPVDADVAAPRHRDTVGQEFDVALPTRTRELSAAIGRVAQELGVHFLDAAQAARTGDDGVHLDVASHRRLAELVAATVTSVLN